MKHIALLTLAASLVVGCSSGTEPPPPPPPPPSAVTISSSAAPPPVWLPATTTVAAGGTVTFKNPSPAAHNIKSATNAWPLVTIEPDESANIVVPGPGTYPYSCTIHAGMNGTLTVK